MSRWPSRGGCARTPGGPVYCLPGHSLSHVLGHPVCSAQGGVLGCGTVSQAVSVVCVPSLSVVQPLDCWSDPMALVALTLWGSGASRRRQSLPDDLHASQSCPDDSEHGSGSVSRSRSTSFSTRWSVFSFREALFARSMRGSSSARASSVRLRRRRRCCSTTPPARRGAQLRPATLLFPLIVVCSRQMETKCRTLETKCRTLETNVGSSAQVNRWHQVMPGGLSEA